MTTPVKEPSYEPGSIKALAETIGYEQALMILAAAYAEIRAEAEMLREQLRAELLKAEQG